MWKSTVLDSWNTDVDFKDNLIGWWRLQILQKNNNRVWEKWTEKIHSVSMIIELFNLYVCLKENGIKYIGIIRNSRDYRNYMHVILKIKFILWKTHFYVRFVNTAPYNPFMLLHSYQSMAYGHTRYNPHNFCQTNVKNAYVFPVVLSVGGQC